MHATLDDVHVYGPSRVVFDVRQHHGQPAPKSEAAEHSLEFLEAERQIPLLKVYVDQELGRGRVLDEPLWGATWAEAWRNFRNAGSPGERVVRTEIPPTGWCGSTS
jgi:hypothetical protein